MNDQTCRTATDSANDSAEREALVALASLPAMYPARLQAVLRFHSASEAVALLRSGRQLHPDLESAATRGGLCAAREQIRDVDAVAVLEACANADVSVLVRGDSGYPDRLELDPDAPEVLFVRGAPIPDVVSVGIVGTRNATAAGRATARHLGGELAKAGVRVVSGLARGIDAAAHLGVRESGHTDAVAVVGSGPDVPYPRVNAPLWEWVAQHGTLLSEWGPGTQPQAWHFPLRNRLIASLSDVVVVVESRESGGSLITARLALDRGIDVMAVPGSRYCDAATGTNRLIADGAGVVCDVEDVLCALGIANRTIPERTDRAQTTDAVGRLGGLDAIVAASCRQRPMTIDELVETLDEPLMAVARSVMALETQGVIQDSGGWFEYTGSRI